MGRDRAQRQPPTMISGNAMELQTRLAASAIPLSGNSLAAFRRALLRWYDQHRRDLPWRKSRDPYCVWLSEIMLQQTRVSAVLDYYRVFLNRFPDVLSLAAASEDAVLAAWSGLGYYRRARMLRQCAKELLQNHGGRFPQTADDLLKLPGIGRYTAAAIASIAFGEAVAVVDGNVERVLARLIGIDLAGPQTWRHAQALLDNSRPGDFNQAMMELGATVCLPREPRCPVCPVRKWCATQGDVPRAGSIEHMPASRQNKKQIWCTLDWRDGKSNDNDNTNVGGNGKVRLVRRSGKASLMPGMWELPQSSNPPRSARGAAHWRTFRHSITVTDYTVHVLRNTAWRTAPFATKGKWIALDRIPQIPITGLTRKILKAGGII